MFYAFHANDRTMELEATCEATCVAAATPCGIAATMPYMTLAREPKVLPSVGHTRLTAINLTAISTPLCGALIEDLSVLLQNL